MQNTLKELLSGRTPVTEYAAAAVLQRAVIQDMMARLELIVLQPETILDVGCATGDTTLLLQKLYPSATLIAVDGAQEMLNYAQQQTTQVHYVNAPAESLPLADHSIDLLVANLVLPWCDELNPLMAEWRRVLRPQGLLLLTSFGPDTLRELHQLPLAFPHLMDMHDLGDLLMHAGFLAPVLDVDYFRVNYNDPQKLWHELKVTGMVAGNTENIALSDGKLSYEVIFAHAWAPERKTEYPADESGTVRIPVSNLLRKK